MKEIYEVKCMDFENNTSKCIVAYADMEPALYKVKELNAKNYIYGEPYFMNKKTISD